MSEEEFGNNEQLRPSLSSKFLRMTFTRSRTTILNTVDVGCLDAMTTSTHTLFEKTGGETFLSYMKGRFKMMQNSQEKKPFKSPYDAEPQAAMKQLCEKCVRQKQSAATSAAQCLKLFQSTGAYTPDLQQACAYYVGTIS